MASHSPAWDGSSLGVVSSTQIVKRYTRTRFYTTHVVWKIKLDNCTIKGMVHSTKNYMPCLIDELAAIFNLTKVGTHSFVYRGKKYVIYRIRKGYTSLKNLVPENITEKMRNKINDVIVFRMIVGLSTLRQISIGCYNLGDRKKFAVVSMDNQVKDLHDMGGFQVSDVINDKWVDGDIKSSLKRMRVSGITEAVKIYDSIDSTVRRIDKNLLWIVSDIHRNIDLLI